MPYKSLLKSEAVAKYVNVTILHETDVQKRLRAETAKLPQGHMQISADQAALLMMLVGLIGAKKALEIGTFTGYSALCVALALPAEGKLVACDVSEEWTSVGKKYWKEAGVEKKIDLRLAPANETLAKMIAGGEAGTFDFSFVDADKDAYDGYYEASLKLLRPGGCMVMDNVLGGPRERDGVHEPEKIKFHALNMKIKEDTRVEAMIATVGAGFMVVRKK